MHNILNCNDPPPFRSTERRMNYVNSILLESKTTPKRKSACEVRGGSQKQRGQWMETRYCRQRAHKEKRKET